MPRRTILLSCIALYALALCWWLSSQHLLVLDEFFAWNLLSDPSWQHAVASWKQGADSGGILYYALLWPAVHLSHDSVLVARMFSSVCYVLAGILWWRALSRFLRPQPAALGVALVWLCSGLLLVYVAQVRFYTPLLLFSALTVWSTLRCADNRVSPWAAALLVAGAHTCLVLVHMLGILYSALLVAGTLLSLAPRRRAFILAAAGIASWIALIPCRTAIHNGSANATSQALPVLRDVLRFHLKSSDGAPVLLIALLGVVWLLRELPHRLRSTHGRRDQIVSGSVLCLAFLASPLSLYVLSHLGRPLGASRYLLPYYLSLATLCAFGFTWMWQAAPARRSNVITLASALLAIALHIVVIRGLPQSPTLDVGRLQELAGGKPVVVGDEQTFFELQYYRSNKDLQFHFLLPPRREHPTGMMATVAARGYFPHSFDHVDDFENAFPEFMFIASTVPGSIPWVTHDPTCNARQVGTVLISRARIAVYDVAGCRSPVPEPAKT